MRILVTGASGLLGVNLALEAAARKSSTVFGQVHNTQLRTSAFNVLQSDLTKPGEVERILDTTQPDWVINCAALAVVDACESDTIQAQKMNIELPRELARYVAKGGARLVHLSTDAVFDGRHGSYTEEDLPNPLSVYGQTKLEGEHAVRSENLEAIIARVNFYGWSLSGKRSLSEFFFNNLLAGNPVMGFTDVFFCPLHVNELANIIFRMLESKLTGLYHVVNQECVSKYEFGVRLARRFNFEEKLIKPTSVEEAGLKAARSPRLTLATGKLKEDLTISLPDLSSGLDRFYSQYLSGYPEQLREMLPPAA